MVKLKW